MMEKSSAHQEFYVVSAVKSTQVSGRRGHILFSLADEVRDASFKRTSQKEMLHFCPTSRRHVKSTCLRHPHARQDKPSPRCVKIGNRMYGSKEVPNAFIKLPMNLKGNHPSFSKEFQ
jgi:hypothetical protein